MAIFHEYDDVETPPEAKDSPRLSELDTTFEDGDINRDISGGKRALIESDEDEKEHNPLRRRLLIDFESDEEDVAAIAIKDVGSSKNPIPPKDLESDAEWGTETQDSFSSEIAIELAADFQAARYMNDGVIHKSDPNIAGAKFSDKKRGLVADKIEPPADPAPDINDAADSKYCPNSLSLSGEGSMEASLILDYSKKILKIQVSHAEVEEALNKIDDDSHIIIISDDEDDAGA